MIAAELTPNIRNAFPSMQEDSVILTPDRCRHFQIVHSVSTQHHVFGEVNSDVKTRTVKAYSKHF